MNFLVAAQAVAETGPTGAHRVSAKDGAEQRPEAQRPHHRPGGAPFKLTPIYVGKSFIQIVPAYDDSESRLASSHVGAGFFQVSDKPARVAEDVNARFGQALFDPARRCTERRPVGRPALAHAMIGRETT